MQRLLAPRVILLLAGACALGAGILVAGGWDVAAFLAINGAAPALPPVVPSGLTVLGHGLVAVVLVAPLLRRAPAIVAAALWGAPIAALLSWTGKRVAQAPRPAAVLDPALVHVQGMLLRGHNSFPSGHSITIFLVAAAILLGLPALPRGRSLAAAVAVVAVATLVALSRVLVGAHWPSDVLGGAALGLLAGAGGTLLARRWPFWQARGAPLVLALLVLACAGALSQADTGYPEALPVQWIAVAAGIGIGLAQAWRALRTVRKGVLP